MRLTRVRIILGVLALGIVAAYLYRRRTQALRRAPESRRDAIARYRTMARKRRDEAPTAEAQRQRLLTSMQRTAVSDDPWEALLRLGTAYKYGQHGVFNPSPDAANACFRCALFTSTDPEIRSRARTLLFSPDVEETDTTPGTPTMPFDIAQVVIRRAQTVAGPNQITQKPRRVIADIPAEVIVTSDAQNTHDHGVSTAVRKTLACLEDPMTDHREAVLRHIASSSCGVSDDAKASAVCGVDSLRSEVDSPYTGMSEVDVLSRVWHAAEEKDNVVLQLAGCIEHGQPVCHSGKVARLVASLETSSPIAVPTWAVRQELYSLASVVRRERLESLDGDSVSLYERGLHPVIAEDMADEFKRRVAEREYAIDPAMLRSMVDDVVQAF